MNRFEGRSALPVYEQLLTNACEKFPPPFGTADYGDIYRAAASDAAWLAVSLVTNAEREGDGAQRLWSLAACTVDMVVAPQIKQHAIDESNHAKIYLRIVDLVFPGSIEPNFRAQLESLSPGYTRFMTPSPKAESPFAHSITLDDLVQMNIAEIRTKIHHLLQRPMLRAHCPSELHPKLARLQMYLLRDEVRHVAYTARLIEDYSRHAGIDTVRRLFSQRLHDFNEVTLSELQQRVFEVT
jgi:hypothetical protein